MEIFDESTKPERIDILVIQEEVNTVIKKSLERLQLKCTSLAINLEQSKTRTPDFVKAIFNEVLSENKTKLRSIMEKLNETLKEQKIGFFFENLVYGLKLYELGVKIFGQIVFINYFNKVDKKFRPSYTLEEELEFINAILEKANQNKLEEYLKIDSLKKLSQDFEKLFISTGIYCQEVLGGEIALRYLGEKEKGSMVLAPPSLHDYDSSGGKQVFKECRLYIKFGSKKSTDIFAGPTGIDKYTLYLDDSVSPAKIIHKAKWNIVDGKIVFSKDPNSQELEHYDSFDDLIEARKSYFALYTLASGLAETKLKTESEITVFYNEHKSAIDNFKLYKYTENNEQKCNIM